MGPPYAPGCRLSNRPALGAHAPPWRGRALAKAPPAPYGPGMVSRSEILVLGLTAGVVGALVGGMMLGIGVGLILEGARIGWLLAIPGAPAGGLIGLLLARRLARQLPR